MRRWKPFPSIGRWLALVIAVIFSVGFVAFAWLIARTFANEPQSWQIDFGFFLQFVAMILMALFAGFAWLRWLQSVTLWYGLDRNAVFIGALGNVEAVQLDQIERIDFGMNVENLPQPLTQGIGCYWGIGTAAGHDRVLIRSSLPASRCLFIVTAHATYAISPTEIEFFVQEIEQLRNLGGTKRMIPDYEAGPWFNVAFWQDNSSKLLLVIAFLINVIAVGLISWYYPALATEVEMRFDAVGGVLELRPRHQTLFLPLTALALTLANLLGAMLFFRYEKLISRMLQGASVVIQILFCVAVLMVVS
jgi:Bacterial PH domain